jgi:tetratricopeptide (TPR) repeat protein/transcriptional regulator with XRE-family HTH domain
MLASMDEGVQGRRFMSDPGSRWQVDGRITLCRDRLKAARRQRGLSQEQVALECAERGLCVSIASLKRAETSSSVLYRTARDIARFYEVDLPALLPQQTAPPQDAAAVPTHDVPLTIARSRSVVLVEACRQGPGRDARDLMEAASAACSLYGAVVEPLADDRLRLVLGLYAATGKEVDKALHCARQVAAGARRDDSGDWGLAVSWGDAEAVAAQPGATPALEPASAALSMRLARSASAGAVVVTDALRVAATSAFAFDPLPAADGIAPARWQLRATAPADGDRLDLVGRRVELQQFRAVLESTQTYGVAQVVGVRGPAGIGKSRLLDEFVRMATLEGWVCHTQQVPDAGVGSSRRLVPDLCLALLGLQDGASDASFETAADGAGLTADDRPLLRHLLQWPQAGHDARMLEATRHEALIDAQALLLARLVTARAQHAPQLLALEDLHWMNDGERQLITDMLFQLSGAVLVVFTMRPTPDATDTLDALASAQASAMRIDLAPLADADARSLAAQIVVATTESQQRYCRECLLRAQGHPLFLEQLLRDAPRHGADGTVPLPRSVQLLTTERADQLPEIDRQAAVAAAVIGVSFELPVLRQVLGLPDYDPQALVRCSLVRRRGDRHAFCHALIREGLYASLEPSSRRALHQRCAQAFAGTDPALHAGHLLHAGVPDAAPAARHAAATLIAGLQFSQAIDLLDAAQPLAAGEDRFAIDMLRTDASLKLGDVEASVQAARRALAAALDDRQRCLAWIELAHGLNLLDRGAAADEALDRAGALAQALDLPAQAARVHYLRGNVLFPRGEVERCEQEHRRSLRQASRVGDAELEARALSGLGDAAYAQGHMYSAYEHFSNCLSLCRRHGLPQVEAANLFMLGTVRIYQNENLLALENAEQSVALARRFGHHRARIVSHLTAGWVLLDLCEAGRAGEHVQAGLDLAASTGARRFTPFLQESLARLHRLRGDDASARLGIHAACEDMQAQGLQAFIGPWLAGTAAQLATAADECEHWLELGMRWLGAGAVGHNHFRFAASAIEALLDAGQAQRALEQAADLERYTRKEPTPWSRLHIDAARARAARLAGDAGAGARIRALADQARTVGQCALAARLMAC